MASTFTTTAPDAKARSIKEMRERDTEKMKEKERGGEGPITKKRKVDDEEKRSNVMPSRSQKGKKRMWIRIRLMRVLRKRGRGRGVMGMFMLIPAPERRNERITAVITKINSTFLVYRLLFRGRRRRRPLPHRFDPNSPLDPETAALHSQIYGLVIETMAMSRASSLPVSSLFKLVMQD